MRQFGLPLSVSILLALCLATAIASPARTFTTLASFDFKDGAFPDGPLVQGTDGNFYGTTIGGGNVNNTCTSYGCGTIFKITPTGTLITLYSFCSNPNCPDGYSPSISLAQGTDGNFYGTTGGGGGKAGGTVFKITSKGKLTTIYNFCSQPNCTDGEEALGGLVQGADGNFYGTTTHGGGTGSQQGGTVFKITTKGKLTTLYRFCSQPNCADGQIPYASLMQATDGNFYGTTLWGGTGQGFGTLFKITSRGALTTLYSFCSQPNCADGAIPYSPLVQGADGNLYGTTEGYGGDFYGKTQENGEAGTVYRITPAGTLTTLYTFCSQPNCADGEYPVGGLAQATDGNFYGTTSDVGVGLGGTVFEITAGGTLTTLYNFGGSDGAVPYDGPVQATDGIFYGLTSAGGILSCDPNNGGCGTAYSLSVGLGRFVMTRPTSGKIGKKVIILGNKLTRTSSVSFNGTAATFKVVSSTKITTNVPKGATTGFVTVTTPKGTLTSNIQFVVP